jgi:membrane-associated protease RseP (regulator of RpoE activity)
MRIDLVVAAMRLFDWYSRNGLYVTMAVPVILFAATVIHECGHIGCGWLFGVPIRGVRIGSGRALRFAQGTRCPVAIGVWASTGHVDFPYLPISRKQRLAMYAAGALATAVAAVAVWFCMAASPMWLRGMTLAVLGYHTMCNLRGEASDGAAIRGLLRVGRRSAQRGIEEQG